MPRCVLHPGVEVTQRVVGCSTQVAGEWQGDIMCALAYILYFMDINFEKNGVAYDKIAFMHALLFNNFVASVDRCYRGAKGTIFGFIPLDSENTKLLEASIINLLNFYIDYHLKAKQTQ